MSINLALRQWLKEEKARLAKRLLEADGILLRQRIQSEIDAISKVQKRMMQDRLCLKRFPPPAIPLTLVVG
jgi:AmiR/NasT family two-component response regulator